MCIGQGPIRNRETTLRISNRRKLSIETELKIVGKDHRELQGMVLLQGHQKLEESTTPLPPRAREGTVKRWSQFLSSAYKCYCSPVFFYILFKNIVIYLFIWLHWVLVAAHEIFSGSCEIFPCDAWVVQMWYKGLVTLQHVGFWFPDQELNPCPLHLEGGLFTVGATGKSQSPVLFFVFFYSLSATSVARLQLHDPTDKESNKRSFQSSNP